MSRVVTRREFQLSSPFVIVAVILAQLTYCWYFFSCPLSNIQDSTASKLSITRWSIAALAVPGLIPGESSLPVQALRQLVHGANLLQRVPIAALACVVVFAAISLGSLVQRLLRWCLGDSIEQPAESIIETPPTWLAKLIEHVVISFGLGVSALSLMMLGLGLAGGLNRPIVVAIVMVLVGLGCYRMWRGAKHRSKVQSAGRMPPVREFTAAWRAEPIRWWITAAACGAGMFLLFGFLSASLPSTDFDALEYHLQGPKEYFLAGRMTFAPHNIYMNMPFGTEMLTLLCMVVAGDWWWGGLVGQTVLACFAPLTALAVAALGRRCFSARAGWIGALVYLSTPWVFRLAAIPHTEGALAFFVTAATLAVCCGSQAARSHVRHVNWLLTGLMAGSAASCKYTALVSTVAPLGLAMLGVARWQPTIPLQPLRMARRWLTPVLFSVGVGLAVGPWFVRNVVWTGNPTYPLLYGVFGGANWSSDNNAKWEWGHRVSLLVALGLQRPPNGISVNPSDPQHVLSLAHFAVSLREVSLRSDWLSPLLFTLAPLALVRGGRAAKWLWLFVGFLFLQWWLMTHRYDRFWVPMLPLVATLAGGGSQWTDHTLWRRFLLGFTAILLIYNFSFCTTAFCGYNEFGARLVPRRHPFDEVAGWLSDHLPPQARVLAVGEAAFFHWDRPVLYNSVFNDSLWEIWLAGRTPQQSHEILKSRGITHVYVNWRAIAWHRRNGGYGLTAFVTPAHFRTLTDARVLRRIPIPIAEDGEFITVNGEQFVQHELFAVR